MRGRNLIIFGFKIMRKLIQNFDLDDYLILDIETTGLDPLTSRITLIGCRWSYQYKFFQKEDEKEMLRDFWNFLEEGNFDFLVGWNIDEFDWKFLKVRSFLLEVPIKRYYKRRERIDLMWVLKTPKLRKLEEYASLLGLKKSSENPIKLFERKNFESLKAYNKRDLDITFEIFKRCLENGLI